MLMPKTRHLVPLVSFLTSFLTSLLVAELALAAPPPAATSKAPSPAPQAAPDDPRLVPDAGQKLVAAKPSPYGTVVVVDEGHKRILRFDGVHAQDQSYLNLDDPGSVPMEYVRYAALGLAYAPKARHILMIGLGGGTFSNLVHRHYPDARIDVVELNPVVAEVAQEHFGVKPDGRYRIIIDDGRAFVERQGDSYDLILVDAYGHEGLPQRLTEEAFFLALRRRLAPGGLLISNFAESRARSAALAAEMAAAFSSSTCVWTPKDGNLLLFGSAKDPLVSKADLATRAAEVDRVRRLPFALAPLAAEVAGCPTRTR